MIRLLSAFSWRGRTSRGIAKHINGEFPTNRINSYEYEQNFIFFKQEKIDELKRNREKFA
jgi:hypothetical protein